MDEKIVKVLTDHAWNVATYSDQPNVVPVGFKSVMPDGKLVVGDIMMRTTVENVKANGKIAVSAFDEKTSEGYQIKGSAVYFSEGPVLEKFRAIANEKFHGAIVVKGVIVISPEKVIVTSPGPDNKKELTL